jgi:hypothetical protein
MRALVMGRAIIILIRRLFIRGIVLAIAQEMLFEFFEVFDVGTLFLEDINNLIDLAKVGTDNLNVFLVLVGASNQSIEFLG